MLKLSKFAAIAFFSAFAINQVYADETPAAAGQEKPVAVVNGVAIPQAHVNTLVKNAAAQGKRDTPELRASIKDELINREVMAQEAVKNGLDKQPDTISQFELAKKNVLVSAYYQDYLKNHPVSEDAIKQEYERFKQTTGPKEYNVRHILVKTENEAKTIAAQLKKGAKFEDLAKKHSLDLGSRDKGGSLGWALPGNFMPAFADALVSLKKGGVSGPVKVDTGWHIIKQEDVRDFKFPDYRDVKGNIMQRLQLQSVQKALDDLRANAKIE